MRDFIEPALYGGVGALMALFVRWCWDEWRSIRAADDEVPE